MERIRREQGITSGQGKGLQRFREISARLTQTTATMENRTKRIVVQIDTRLIPGLQKLATAAATLRERTREAGVALKSVTGAAERLANAAAELSKSADRIATVPRRGQ